MKGFAFDKRHRMSLWDRWSARFDSSGWRACAVYPFASGPRLMLFRVRIKQFWPFQSYFSHSWAGPSCCNRNLWCVEQEEFMIRLNSSNSWIFFFKIFQTDRMSLLFFSHSRVTKTLAWEQNRSAVGRLTSWTAKDEFSRASHVVFDLFPVLPFILIPIFILPLIPLLLFPVFLFLFEW